MKPTPKSAPRFTSPDAAKPVGAMTLVGVVKTTKGYAVATVKLDEEGAVTSVTLGGSQFYKEHVAREQKGAMVAAVQAA